MKENSAAIKTIKKALPAVVSVMITKTLGDLEQEAAKQPVGEIFGMPFFFGNPNDQKIDHKKHNHNKKVPVGGGSGFLVSRNGMVLTNKHVVVDPDAEYTVIAQSGKKYKAHVLARDPINDVAILKIQEANSMPFLELADSYKLELGQTVIAIGNALGNFQNTVSMGIISGLSRFITAQNPESNNVQRLRGLIQTDAAINPGNSGGPLVDLEGKVIGINTAIIFGAQNIGFAIPIDSAKKDLESVQKFGRIRIPSLGVRHLIITPGSQQEFHLPVSHGALVMGEHLPNDFAVIPGSPAAKAGVAEGDIILEFNEKKITPENNLEYLLNQCQIGQTVALKILRKNKEKILKAVLGERK